jgi:small subunit ribosomal protein S2
MKELLEAGVHFGHQTKRWNPKMQKYIFDERNNIYVINLQKTVKKFKEAAAYIIEVVSHGGEVLFVGTKKQAKDSIRDEARRCGMHFMNQRWLGGTLTNFSTIQKSIQRLRRLEQMKEEGELSLLTKKEAMGLERKRERLEKFLGGIKFMDRLPDVVFVVDPKKERIAVHEANVLGIPVVGIVDTNCDPDPIDFVVPGNDDAIRAIKLFASRVSDAVIEGKYLFQERLMGQEKEEADEEDLAVRSYEPEPSPSADVTDAENVSDDANNGVGNANNDVGNANNDVGNADSGVVDNAGADNTDAAADKAGNDA